MSKNTHLEHLEDSILLDGKKGAEDAFFFLDLLAKTFSGKTTSNFKVTTKWDGAPAIFCGIYPGTSLFFVGTKSIFNKDAKINFTNEDIERNHGHAPGLVDKLKSSLKYLPQLGIKGVAQGDLLFTDDKKFQQIDGERCIVFKPNTITYSIPDNNEYFDKANAAKIGVVFHTTYTGNSIESLRATFGYDVSKLNESKDILVLSAEMDSLGSDVLLTKGERDKLVRMKSTSSALIRNTGDVLDILAEHIAGKDMLALGHKLKQYFNTYVREGKSVDGNFLRNFENYFEKECFKEVDKVKQSKTKAAKLKKLYDGQALIAENKESFIKIIKLYKQLQDAKEVFITKLQKGEKFGTYLMTDNGLEITNPEGYVVIANGTKAFKFVNRLSFSQANFKKDAVASRWMD